MLSNEQALRALLPPGKPDIRPDVVDEAAWEASDPTKVRVRDTLIVLLTHARCSLEKARMNGKMKSMVKNTNHNVNNNSPLHHLVLVRLATLYPPLPNLILMMDTHHSSYGLALIVIFHLIDS